MSDDAQFNVNIGTTADTSGADQEVDALQRVKDAADAANDAQSGHQPGESVAIDQGNMQAALDSEASARAAIAGSAADTSAADQASLEAEERKNSLLTQRQIIVDQQVEALAAEAAGDDARAIALREEIEIRTTALGLQQRAAFAEEEAFAAARAMAAAEQTVTAQKAAQAALNAENVAAAEAEVAAEEAKSKVYGRGGQVGNALKNVGVDTGIATTIGLGVIAATELNRIVTEVAKHLDEERIQAEKLSDEFQKQVSSWREMASLATDQAGVEKVVESVSKSLAGLQEKMQQLPAEGTKGFFQNAADAAATYGNAIVNSTGATRIFLSAIPGFANLLSTVSAGQVQFKTSTDAAQQSLIDQGEAARKAGEVFEDFAKKQAAWFESLKTQPLADQIGALIEKEGELITAQAAVAEGTKAWENYQKQIDEVVKAEDKAITAQSNDAESLAKLDDQITKLTADRAKLTADQPKAGTPNAFVPVEDETIGGQKTTNYYHPADTTTNASGNVISKSGATPVDPNDPALKAFIEANKKLELIDQHIVDLKEKRNAEKEDMTGKPGAPRDTPDSLDGRATPDADESDLQSTLDERGAEDLKDAATKTGDAAAKTLSDAADQFSEIPPHFDTFKLTIDTGVQAINTKAGAANDSLTNLITATQDGFQQIGDTTSKALTDLQQQITTVNQQLQSYIASYNP